MIRSERNATHLTKSSKNTTLLQQPTNTKLVANSVFIVKG